jgi:hypothetical protein
MPKKPVSTSSFASGFSHRHTSLNSLKSCFLPSLSATASIRSVAFFGENYRQRVTFFLTGIAFPPFFLGRSMDRSVQSAKIISKSASFSSFLLGK